MVKPQTAKFIGWMALVGMLCLAPSVCAQDRNGYRDGDRGSTRIERGTVIPVRMNSAIDIERRDNRVYTGVVDQDVRGDNGRLAIPRGATAEMIVRGERDNDLILDLGWVTG